MSEDPKPPTSKWQEDGDQAKETLPVHKLMNEIMAAVRAGGANPDHNPRLQSILQKCHDSDVPSDEIDELIMKLGESLATGDIVRRPDVIAADIASWLYF